MERNQKRFEPLGIVATSASTDALLASLRALRPQFEVRLRRISDAAGIETLYRVEVAIESGPDADTSGISTWLDIKSALMAAFPAGKPGAVKVIDP
jgi:hypothetical protein